MLSQTGWRWCHKCQGMFFSGNPSQGVCPADNHAHDGSQSGHYAAFMGDDAAGQQGWRWCLKCQGMFFDGDLSGGACPADHNAHDGSQSGHYAMVFNSQVFAASQNGWQRCTKCEGFSFFGNPTQGACPAGGAHAPEEPPLTNAMPWELSPCNCNSCDPDPKLTCSYSGQDYYVEDAYLANAYPGNLLLTPGDSRGVIGGLLHALTPAQHYSHMGIVIANTLIRHCTSSQERLIAKEYYSGSLLGIAAPLDGLNVDHVQYGWPGTITQSVYQAFYADRYGGGLTPPGHTGPYQGSMLPDMESAQSPKSAYLMSELSFDPVSDDGLTWYPVLIVKPCPLLQTPIHTDALNHVAQQALATYAHYRFFAYSSGSVGGDSAFNGPTFTVPDAQPVFDSSTGRWTDWADGINWVTKPTIGAVCSSFAWQVIQNFFNPGVGARKLILDWAKSQADALGEDNGACVRSVEPLWPADVIDADTQDGLYLYSEAQRKIAAQSLHDNLSQTVFDSLKQTLHDEGGLEKTLAAVVDDVGRAAFIAAATGGVSALTSLLGPLLTAAGAVFDAVLLGNLIELLYDMPEDIANQMCNSFAFDCTRGFPADTRCVDALGNEIASVDSSNWSSAPGPGRAVSPDNIHMFWDAPAPVTAGQVIQGLYGYNVPAQLVVGVFRRPYCVTVPSTGTATIEGFVYYQGKVLAGAYVSTECQYTISQNPHSTTFIPGYILPVRSGGQYKLIARYEDTQAGVILYGEGVTGVIAPNSVVPLNITVIAPPASRRNVTVKGIIRCDDVYLTGRDSAQQSFSKTLNVQYGVPYFDINTNAWLVDTSQGQQRLTDVAFTNFSVGDSHASLTMSAQIKPDLSVTVTLTGSLNPGDENMSWGPTTYTVLQDQTINLTDGTLDTGGPFNDRAYFTGLSIANVAAPAI
jgi:hypothetical protein